MERSEEAYTRFRAGEKKAHIARDMNVRRGTVRGWIDREMDKRDETYSFMRTMKKLLGLIE